MSWRIESYAYSEGPAAAAGDSASLGEAFEVANIVGAIVDGYTGYARLAAPVRFAAALVEWSAALTAYFAAEGVATPGVTLAYDAAAQRVTVQVDDAGGGDLLLPGSMAAYLGITQASPGGLIITGESMPAGCVGIMGARILPPADAARVTMDRLRHGRTDVVAWGNVAAQSVRVYLTRADRAAWESAGWCMTGRIRIVQGDGGAFDSAYSATNLAGYLDGYVFGATKPEPLDRTESVYAVDLSLAVQP